jgi:hypothetical protein
MTMRSAPARPRTRGPTRGRGRSTQRSPTSKRAPVRSTPERSTSVLRMQARLPHRSAALAADALRPSTRRPSRGARSRRSRAAWERVGPACVEGARSGLARPLCCGELRAITAWWPASPRGSAPQRRAHRSALPLPEPGTGCRHEELELCGAGLVCSGRLACAPRARGGRARRSRDQARGHARRSPRPRGRRPPRGARDLAHAPPRVSAGSKLTRSRTRRPCRARTRPTSRPRAGSRSCSA